MTGAERRLAAAAACLAGGRAGSLLARGATAEVRAEAIRLARLPRDERLHALARALPDASPATAGARAAQVARGERRKIAELVTRLAQTGTGGPGIAPALARAIRERLAR